MLQISEREEWEMTNDQNNNYQAQQPANPFAAAYANDNTVSGVERVKKGKGKKVAVISGVSAAVIAGGAIAAYNLSPFVKNQVKLRTMKPEKYYAWVQDENVHELAKDVADMYGDATDRIEKGSGGNFTLKYTASDTVRDMLAEDLFEDYDAENSEFSEEEIRDIIDSLGNAKLGLDYAGNDGVYQFSAFADLNDETLATLDLVIDAVNYEVFLRVPELNEQYISISSEEYLKDELGLGSTNVYTDMLKHPSDYISSDDIEEEIVRYAGVWIDTVNDVELEKSEEVEIGDITSKYTVATVEVNEKLLGKLAKNLLNEVRDDDIIKELLIDKLEIMDEDEFLGEIDEALEELEDAEYDTEVVGIVKTYIDAKGKIRGISITDADNENGGYYLMGRDGDEIRGEFRIFEDDEDIVRVDLTATESNKKVYDGSIDVAIYGGEEEYTGSVEFEDFEITNEEKNYINADISIKVMDYDPIDIEFRSDGDSQEISCDIEWDDNDYGTITLIYSSSDDLDISVPDKSGSFEIDPEDIESVDINEYITRDDLKRFVKDIMLKFNFTEDKADKLAGELADEAFDEFEDREDTTEYDDFVY